MTSLRQHLCLSTHLNVTWPVDVLAVVAPVARRTEPLRSEFSVENSGHLDAVAGFLDVGAVGVVLEQESIANELHHSDYSQDETCFASDPNSIQNYFKPKLSLPIMPISGNDGAMYFFCSTALTSTGWVRLTIKLCTVHCLSSAHC